MGERYYMAKLDAERTRSFRDIPVRENSPRDKYTYRNERKRKNYDSQDQEIDCLEEDLPLNVAVT